MIAKLLSLANIIMMITFILKINQLPSQLPLFYSLPWGEDQIGETWMIFIIPFIMTGFIIINNFLEKKIFSNNQLIKKIFYYLNLLIIISFTFIFLKIIFLIS